VYTLFIYDQEQIITTADNIRFHVMFVRIKKGSCGIELRDLAADQDMDDIFVVRVVNGELHPLAVADNVRKAIASFLSNQHGKLNMDFMCFDFAHSVAFDSARERTQKADTDWGFIPFTPKDLEPGSVVMLCGEKKDGKTPFSHAAVYLGEDLYISVYGAGGDLEVSKLDAMQREFPCKEVRIAIPRS